MSICAAVRGAQSSVRRREGGGSSPRQSSFIVILATGVGVGSGIAGRGVGFLAVIHIAAVLSAVPSVKVTFP